MNKEKLLEVFNELLKEWESEASTVTHLAPHSDGIEEYLETQKNEFIRKFNEALEI